jgi:hypothetical protein
MDSSFESTSQLPSNIAHLPDGRQCAISHTSRGLLDLPVETLMDIASNLTAKNLQSLALACRILGSISREALVRTVPVAPRNIWKLLNVLLSYPDLQPKMKRLQIHPLSEEAYRTLKVLDKEAAISMTAEQLTACINIVQGSLPEGSEPVQGLLDGENFTSDALSILLAITPNLTELSISTDLVDCLPVLGTIFRDTGLPKAPVAPAWHALAVSRLKEQLADLNIREEVWWYLCQEMRDWKEKCECKGWLRFELIPSLKRLTVPFNRLGYEPLGCENTGGLLTILRSHMKKACPKSILPSSLEYLRMTFGRESIDGEMIGAKKLTNPPQLKMSWINDIFDSTEHFHRLRCIELETDYTALDTIWRLSHGWDTGHGFDNGYYFDWICKWSCSDIQFNMFFGELNSAPFPTAPERGRLLNVRAPVERCKAYTQRDIFSLIMSVKNGTLVECGTCQNYHAPPRCRHVFDTSVGRSQPNA